MNSTQKEKNQFLIYILVLVGVASFSMGMLFSKTMGENYANGNSNKDDKGLFDKITKETSEELTEDDVDILNEVYGVLEKKYVNEMPQKQQLIDGAVKGMVDSLEDPYTIYYTDEEIKSFNEDMQGSFEGIGAEVGMRDDLVTIISPLEGMPAEKSGLKAGDKIIKIDDESATDLSLEEAIKRIKGPKGTTVKLTVFRDGENNGEPIEIEVIRDKIDIKSVKWEMKEGNVAYLRLNGFYEDTITEFDKAAKEIEESEAQKIVLDLRNNAGGYLHTSVAIAGYFLEKGKLVVEEDYGDDNKHKNRSHFTEGNAMFADYDIVILVNEGTASAAEILAGSIKDHRGVSLIGEKTYGKGSVQEVEDDISSGAVKVTVAKWLTPSGVNISEEGISVDIEQEIATDEDIAEYEKKIEENGDQAKFNEDEEPVDRQLEKALEVIKE